MDWIYVIDRYPTEEESELNILVWDLQEGVHEAEYHNGTFSYPYYGQEVAGEFTDVRAWRELPLPPKNKSKQQ